MRRIFHRAALLYLVATAFVLLKEVFLRHPAEQPDLYSLYYRDFLLKTCLLSAGLAIVSYIRLIKTKARKANSLRGALEFCEICQESVHERSIHCPYCQQCTIGMRAHCIWSSSCIGLHNYKYALLLLFYFTISGAFFSFAAVRYIWGQAPDYLEQMSWKVLAYLHLAAVAGLWIDAVLLLCTHSLLLINNMTMLDLRNGKVPARGPCNSGAESSEYDLGSLANLRNALGSEVLWWLLPTAPDLAAVEADLPRCPPSL
jgi:hypothetical protein